MEDKPPELEHSSESEGETLKIKSESARTKRSRPRPVQRETSCDLGVLMFGLAFCNALLGSGSLWAHVFHCGPVSVHENAWGGDVFFTAAFAFARTRTSYILVFTR